MQIHNLKRTYKLKRHKHIGRGGKRGKTSGRGGKGQTARAGAKIRPEIRDMIKRMPKLRGRGKNSNVSIQTKYIVVNIAALEGAFSSGDVVTSATIVKKGLAEMYKGRNPQVKILGTGELTKKLSIVKCLVSVEAKAKIEKAGGSVK